MMYQKKLERKMRKIIIIAWGVITMRTWKNLERSF
jgi:hypothetical protein